MYNLTIFALCMVINSFIHSPLLSLPSSFKRPSIAGETTSKSGGFTSGETWILWTASALTTVVCSLVRIALWSRVFRTSDTVRSQKRPIRVIVDLGSSRLCRSAFVRSWWTVDVWCWSFSWMVLLANWEAIEDLEIIWRKENIDPT